VDLLSILVHDLEDLLALLLAQVQLPQHVSRPALVRAHGRRLQVAHGSGGSLTQEEQ